MVSPHVPCHSQMTVEWLLTMPSTTSEARQSGTATCSRMRLLRTARQQERPLSSWESASRKADGLISAASVSTSVTETRLGSSRLTADMSGQPSEFLMTWHSLLPTGQGSTSTRRMILISSAARHSSHLPLRAACGTERESSSLAWHIHGMTSTTWDAHSESGEQSTC